jgi:hypothetical protein
MSGVILLEIIFADLSEKRVLDELNKPNYACQI